MNYQSCICKKCGHVYLPSPTTKFCSFCGAEVPKYEEKQEITCPCCQGTGKVEPSAQPFNPVKWTYFGCMTNENKRGEE